MQEMIQAIGENASLIGAVNYRFGKWNDSVPSSQIENHQPMA